jgi:hypothetical protein
MTAGDGATGDGSTESDAPGSACDGGTAGAATWASLFDRAAGYDVDVADVRTALDERRGSGGDGTGGDGTGGDGTGGDGSADDHGNR